MNDRQNEMESEAATTDIITKEEKEEDEKSIH